MEKNTGKVRDFCQPGKVGTLITLYKRLNQILMKNFKKLRVPTRPGKPGKMRVYLENLEISWNFVKFNKYHGKMTCNLEKLCGY